MEKFLKLFEKNKTTAKFYEHNKPKTTKSKCPQLFGYEGFVLWRDG